MNHKGRSMNKRRTNMIKRVKAVVTAFVLIFVLSFGFGSIFTSAHGAEGDSPSANRYYKSIEIESGDTLWTIAKEYHSPCESTVEEYFDELLELNHLDSSSADHLRAGDYLTIYYCE